MICPSTRVLTATVASGSTVPGAARMTGMSASTTAAAVTGAAPALPLPSGFLLAVLPVAGDAGLLPGSSQKKYAAPAAMAAQPRSNPSRLIVIASRPPLVRRPAPCAGPASVLLPCCRQSRAGKAFAREGGPQILAGHLPPLQRETCVTLVFRRSGKAVGRPRTMAGDEAGTASSPRPSVRFYRR